MQRASALYWTWTKRWCTAASRYVRGALFSAACQMVPNADCAVPVEIDGIEHNVYVIKRPGVDEFLRQMGRIFEVVVFTASLNKVR